MANERRPRGEDRTASPEDLEQNHWIKELLSIPRTIAVVGMSPSLDRPSRQVGTYLHTVGHDVIPIHPTARDISGLHAFPSLLEIPDDRQVDIVDVIVSAKHAGPVAEQAAQIGAKVIWFQPGAENPEQEQRARDLGLGVISGRCIMADHMLFVGHDA